MVRAAHVSAAPRDLRIISCHLGNGASVCAIDRGMSVDTSMGLTALEGLVMGSRLGDVDAGMFGYLLYALVAFPIISRPTGQHIEYVSPHFFAAVTMTLYLLSTALSPLLSTHRMVVVFGALALLSFGAAYAFYATWFISVWCFFAALLSAVVYFHVSQHGRERPVRTAARTRPATQRST